MNKIPGSKAKAAKLGLVKYKLLHCTENHARPVVFSKERHESYAGWQHYPIYIVVGSKELRLATDYIIQLPFIYVRASIPFEITYPINEIFIH